jgi:hypothetical protein
MLQTLVGEFVIAKTIAGNSISLWFSVEPRHPDARRLWIDPPWRILTPTGIESSSYGFPGEKEDGETESQYRTRFETACANSDCLKGAVVLSVTVDGRSGDLALQFADGRLLQMFALDLSYENWHYTDHRRGKRYGVQVTGVDVEDLDA